MDYEKSLDLGAFYLPFAFLTFLKNTFFGNYYRNGAQKFRVN